MEVMKPDLYVAQGFRFRVNVGSSSGGGQTSGGGGGRYLEDEDEFRDVGGFCEQDGYDGDDSRFAEVDVDVDVREPYPGKFEARVPIPSALFGAVIGKRGATKMRIEKETQAALRVPKVGAEGDVVISAAERSRVLAAARRLLVIVETQRHKLKFTHFVALPMVGEPMRTRCEEFRRAVYECCSADEVDERLFANPEKRHATLVLMTLLDDRERAAAVDMMKQCFEEKIRPKLASVDKLQVHIRGLEIMNDDPAEAQVLYARVNPVRDSSGQRDIVQEIADDVVHFFESSGLTPSVRSENVKLHVTLMNAKFMSSDDSEDEASASASASAWKARPKPGQFKTFDARVIFENLRDFDFGIMSITEMHLSQLYTVGDDGYYRPSLVIPLFE